MAKERILSGIEFDLQAHTINVKWIDRFTEDGELINERVHRGAYPVDANNEVDDSVKTLLGASLQDIIGEAGEAAQMRVGVIEKQLNHCDSVIHNLRNENESLTGSLFQKNEQIVNLSNLLTAKDTEILMLKNEVAALKNNQ